MKELNKKTTLYILGTLIISIFTFISVSNLLNFQKESNNYYIKLNDKIEEKIEIIEVNNNKLIIKTNDDRISYCAKTTKSTPTLNSICWKNVSNNEAVVNLFTYKQYYLWLKYDKEISNQIVIPTKNTTLYKNSEE